MPIDLVGVGGPDARGSGGNRPDVGEIGAGDQIQDRSWDHLVRDDLNERVGAGEVEGEVAMGMGRMDDLAAHSGEVDWQSVMNLAGTDEDEEEGVGGAMSRGSSMDFHYARNGPEVHGMELGGEGVDCEEEEEEEEEAGVGAGAGESNCVGAGVGEGDEGGVESAIDRGVRLVYDELGAPRERSSDDDSRLQTRSIETASVMDVHKLWVRLSILISRWRLTRDDHDCFRGWDDDSQHSKSDDDYHSREIHQNLHHVSRVFLSLFILVVFNL